MSRMKWYGYTCVNFNQAIGFRRLAKPVFHIPVERQLFRECTLHSDTGKPNAVIMGLQTWLSQHQKPMPKRLNCVLTTQAEYYRRIYSHFGVEFFSTMPECRQYLETFSTRLNNAYVIGGQQLFEYSLSHQLLDYMYRVEILTPNYVGDLNFPDHLMNQFVPISELMLPAIEGRRNDTRERIHVDARFRAYAKKI